MENQSETKEKLLEEISELKKKVKKLEKSASQHKQMENALRESELKYRSVVECSSDAIFCVNEKGQYQFTNSLFASTFGKPPDYFIGKTFWDIYPKEHADQRFEVTKRVFATGQSESVEVEVPLPDRTLYFYATADPIHDETGKVILNLTHGVNITERKLAEAQSKATLAALRESEASLAEAQRIARIGSWDWDMISNTVKWSKEMYRVFGINPEDFDGKPQSLLKVIHPDDIELFTNTMNSNLSKGNPTSLEFRVIHKSGYIHHIFASGIVEFNEDDRPIRNIGTAQDITERKQAEEELRDKHQRLELALLGGGLGIWDWHPQTGAVVYSDLWAQMLEYTPDEVEPTVEFFKQHIHPDDLPAVLERLTGHVEGRMPVYMSEHRLRTKSGKWLWVLDHGRIAENDKHGRPVRVTGVIVDITNRKQAERTLMLMQSSIEAASDALYWIKPDSRIVNVNESACRLLGYTKEELLQLCVPDIDTGYNAKIWKLHFPELRKKRSLKFNSTHRAKDGRLIPVEIVANYIQFGNEEFNCAFVRNITNR